MWFVIVLFKLKSFIIVIFKFYADFTRCEAVHLTKSSFQVEHNILKLELKRLRQTLNQQADGVLSLNKRRLQLQKAMDERKIDIGIHTDMLQQQIKHTQGEKSKIRFVFFMIQFRFYENIL